jgi:uncharacterized membrane protein (UPF0127 family)
MSIPLDLIFTNKNNIVTKVVSNVAPWRLAFGAKSTYKVIELPIGIIEKTDTKVGDALQVNTLNSKDFIKNKKSSLRNKLDSNSQEAITMK